jgi:WS/DGAT/MGAT family acyltransferase
MSSERLGAIDESYLVAESPATPLHVASLGVFEPGQMCDSDGTLRLDRIRNRISAGLDLLPRMRQRVAEVPFGVHRPVWVDDVDFDIARHVDAVRLASPGDEAALLRLTEDLIMQPLDRAHPLWHLRFVTGLEGGRVALIERAHHAMIDGVSGVDVSLSLLDTDPDAPEPDPSPWTARPTPGTRALLRDGLAELVSTPFAAVTGVVGAARHPDQMAATTSRVTTALRAMRGEGIRAPACSINGPIGTTRELHVIRERLADVRAAGAPHGATVNDVVLAAVASGLRDLFLERGEVIKTDRTVTVLIPVSVRDASESMALGNRVGGLLAALPIGIGDPMVRLRMIAETTARLKASGEATTADQLLRAIDLLPPQISRPIARGLDRQPLVNMVVTNIPGPSFPLYALGGRMVEAFPVVPLGANMTLEVAVLSYDGALNLCVTSDREACPDAGVFVAGVEHGFAALHASWEPALT